MSKIVKPNIAGINVENIKKKYTAKKETTKANIQNLDEQIKDRFEKIGVIIEQSKNTIEEHIGKTVSIFDNLDDDLVQNKPTTTNSENSPSESTSGNNSGDVSSTPTPTSKPNSSGKTKYSDVPAAKTSNMDPYGELPGSNNEEKIWIYCKSKGYTDAQAAAVVGNAQVESWNWNYALRNSDNGQYYGLFMNSHQYAGSYNGKTAKQQLDLMDSDLKGRMNYWNSQGYNTSYSSWQTYSGANDVNAATSAFMYGYEGTLRDQMLAERQQYARAAYNKYAGKY